MKPNWKKCTDLPEKCWVTSVTVLNEKVYMAMINEEGRSSPIPYVYDFKQDKGPDPLRSLPFLHFCLVTVHNKNCILAIGGVNGDEMSNKVYTWNGNDWSNEYPDMPTARSRASSICYESSVIVAGGITKAKPLTITKAVEVLKIDDKEWYVVDQLPHIVYSAIPLIIGDTVYLGVGYDGHIKVTEAKQDDSICKDDSTCNIIKASLPDLLKSDNQNTISKSIWIKLPDMPYSSWSINHYKNHLIAFTGDSLVLPTEKYDVVCQNVPLIYIYNSRTFSWDCVDDLSGTIDFYLGRSIHVNENTILFMGGITGRHENTDDVVTACYTLTFEP